ncbi:MAG: hypothetical protein ACTMUB_02085 [cyanobacterium endosymbiont of Rhopalodia musculus]|nr:hypothetical protein [cyanobacterium endosymbiont of Epithemia clementina EcSB]WGT67022.1 hypothetical protein P3F56_07255 [cyanobacterium endosymbiont of Epithemia clementina EcSB]
MNNYYQDILDFWLGQFTSINYGNTQKFWFIKKLKFDQAVRSRFL